MNKEIPKTYALTVEFDKNFSKIGNSGFRRGTCKIAYAGKNRNFSDIPKEAFEKAKDSLSLIPIVGHWVGTDKGGFGGHDVAIELSGNNADFKSLTIPYGVVPQDNNPEWFDVEDENGNIKKYYKTDIVLWYDRNPEQVQFIIDNDGVNQSMEIDVVSGEWTEDYKYFKINEFEYSALCLLGRDNENPDNSVEPCFEDSEITISQFALDKDEFKSEFTLMMNELKKAYSDTSEEKKEETNNNKIIFELSHDDIRGKIYEKLNPINEDGYHDWNYWIMKVFDTYAIVEDEKEVETYYKIPYSISEDDEVKLGEFERVYLMFLNEEEKVELETMRNEYTQLKESNNTLEAENAQLKSDNEELASFKSDKLQAERTEQETELFARYDENLDPEDESYKAIKETKSDFSIEELESKLAVLYTRKKLNFSSNKNNKIIKLGGDSDNAGELSPYGNLFEKHGVNNNKEEK